MWNTSFTPSCCDSGLLGLDLTREKIGSSRAGEGNYKELMEESEEHGLSLTVKKMRVTDHRHMR